MSCAIHEKPLGGIVARDEKKELMEASVVVQKADRFNSIKTRLLILLDFLQERGDISNQVVKDVGEIISNSNVEDNLKNSLLNYLKDKLSPNLQSLLGNAIKEILDENANRPLSFIALETTKSTAHEREQAPIPIGAVDFYSPIIGRLSSVEPTSSEWATIFDKNPWMNFAYIANWYVLSHGRKRGVGKKLIQEGIEYCLRQNSRISFFLSTHPATTSSLSRIPLILKDTVLEGNFKLDETAYNIFLSQLNPFHRSLTELSPSDFLYKSTVHRSGEGVLTVCTNQKDFQVIAIILKQYNDHRHHQQRGSSRLASHSSMLQKVHNIAVINPQLTGDRLRQALYLVAKNLDDCFWSRIFYFGTNPGLNDMIGPGNWEINSEGVLVPKKSDFHVYRLFQ